MKTPTIPPTHPKMPFPETPRKPGDYSQLSPEMQQIVRERRQAAKESLANVARIFKNDGAKVIS